MSTDLKDTICAHVSERSEEVENWFTRQASQAAAPFYCSVDLRDAGFKIAPVDCNLYPAGFHLICPADLEAAGSLFQAEIKKRFETLGLSKPERALVIPEAHTKNPHYLENLYYLLETLRSAGFDTRLGWYSESAEAEAVSLALESGHTLQAEPLRIAGGVAEAGGFVPDFIVLNNDFSSGYPAPLDAITQPIFPSQAMGWHSRKKSTHFDHYNTLATRFSELLGIDPWCLQIRTEAVDGVDFNEGLGLDRVAATVDRVLQNIRADYSTRSIAQEPFVFVKSNTGTYGMGIMVVRDASEISLINRREKNKMSVGKNRLAIKSVIVQEGIPTIVESNTSAAEPVIYLVGTRLLGGFLRTHPTRGAEGNLNSTGMLFERLCMSNLERAKTRPDLQCRLERVYGSLGHLSALAAGLEAPPTLSPLPRRDLKVIEGFA